MRNSLRPWKNDFDRWLAFECNVIYAVEDLNNVFRSFTFREILIERSVKERDLEHPNRNKV